MGQSYPSHPIPAVAAVVLKAEDDGSCSVLLVRRVNPPSEGEWSLPGGVLELGETLTAGVVREVREETGMEVEPLEVVAVLDLITREGPDGAAASEKIRFHYVLIDYLCRVTGGRLAPASDAREARWVLARDVIGRDMIGRNGFALQSRTMEVIEKAMYQWGKRETEPPGIGSTVKVAGSIRRND